MQCIVFRSDRPFQSSIALVSMSMMMACMVILLIEESGRILAVVSPNNVVLKKFFSVLSAHVVHQVRNNFLVVIQRELSVELPNHTNERIIMSDQL